jgi:hypothetical protein
MNESVRFFLMIFDSINILLCNTETDCLLEVTVWAALTVHIYVHELYIYLTLFVPTVENTIGSPSLVR